MGIEIAEDGSLVDTDTGLTVMPASSGGIQQNQGYLEAQPKYETKASQAYAKTSISKEIQAPNQQGSFNVVKAAKARRKVLKAEIKQMRKLEKELAQLERLIAAASTAAKPLPSDTRFNVVRDIKRTAK